MTDTRRLAVERDGATVIARFSHAPTRNSLDRDTRAGLMDLLEEWDADPEIRVVLLTGVDPAFTSGVDATQLLSEDYEPLPRNPADVIRAMDTPTIAAVNGACVSGGLEIALACSFVIASQRARFADTHAKLGLLPGWGLSAELPARIGPARARQLTLTAAFIDAATALRWGLVNEVVPHDGLADRAQSLAEAIAALDEGVVRASVRLYRQGQDAALGPARLAEQAAGETWSVDRAQARQRLQTPRPSWRQQRAAQSVSPPST
nr:enoyl-CoA hydratase-related protein [Microbacterium bovistercoris]